MPGHRSSSSANINDVLSRRQVLAASGAALLGPVLGGTARGQSQTRPATVPSAAAAAIAEQCDAILAAAIRSPFGYGWNEAVEGIDLGRTRPKGKPPSIDAKLTAAAGMALHLAGEATGIAAYTSAAVEAGRGLLAIQTRPGQIRALGVMGAFGGTRDEATDVPDRAPTCAALATLLMILASQTKQDVRLRGPAMKSAHWLAGQQSRAGGWPGLFPPDAPQGEGDKLLLLNDINLRNTALTTLLASEVLSTEDYQGHVRPERQLQHHFSRGVDMLIFARVGNDRALWPTACRLDGDANTRQEKLPICIDLLSSRHCLEVLLAGYLVAQEAAYRDALTRARDAISSLPRDQDKGWYRRYDLQLKPILPLKPDEGGVFRQPIPAEPEGPPPQTPLVFGRLEKVLELGAKQSFDAWQAVLPMNRRLALVIGGFEPDAMLADRLLKTGSEPGDAIVLPGAIGSRINALRSLTKAVSNGQ